MEDFVIQKQDRYWFDKDQENRLFIKLSSGEIVQQFSVKEIFTKKNLPPIVFIAETSGGKSILCSDVVKQCAEGGFNNIVYFTSDVVYSPQNTYVLQHVPQAFIQTKDIIQQLCYLLEKLLQETREDNQIQRMNYLSDEEKRQFYQIEDQFFQKIKTSQYSYDFLQGQLYDGDQTIPELQQLFQTDKLNDFINFQIQNDKLFQEKLDKNSFILVQGKQVSKQYVYNEWKQFLEKTQSDLQKEQVKFQQQIIQNKLKEQSKDKQELFTNQLLNQKGELYELYKACQQERRSCLIMDDLSSLFSKQAGQKPSIEYQGQILNEKDAFAKVINNLLNQGRHIGTSLICVHSIQTLNSNNLQYLSIIMMTPNNEFKNNRSTFLQNSKLDILYLQSVLKEVNAQNKTHYLLICYKDESQSPDGKSKYGILQADFQQYIDEKGITNVNEELYKSNPYFYKIAQLNNQQEEQEKKEVKLNLDDM